ncbi:MAG: DNA methyltransferase, partial [Bradyrhizobium sp.]|nr:DNA methyltransferase [Bradyrhizobium sp.]
DPADLSNMEWHTFVAAYKRIIMRSIERLKDNRFACFVVGDFRDERGFYRDFVSTTIRAFEECGARLYNEAILVTSVGSASMRVTKQFEASRKMAKTHQNVLVFCKGDPKLAAKVCKGQS